MLDKILDRVTRGDNLSMEEMAGVIDLDKERDRLQKRWQKINQQIQSARRQLDNPNFINRAPAEIVEQKRQQLAEFEAEQQKLEANLKMLS